MRKEMGLTNLQAFMFSKYMLYLKAGTHDPPLFEAWSLLTSL